MNATITTRTIPTVNINPNYLLNKIKSQDFNTLIDTTILTKLEKFLLQYRPLLSKVFRFIETHYQYSISLREVAKAVDRSPAYLTDLVRRETGKTVLFWITARRMAEARRLLVETDQSVEKITEAVGYFDRRHFSRQFIRYNKTTPQDWRRKHRNNNNPFLQIDPQTANSEKLIKQKATTLTSEEAEQLKVYVQEIAVILNKNTSTEALILENIEKGYIVKTDDGLVQVTLMSTKSTFSLFGEER
ncbi:helix-turn-helix transcriptional regulator [Pleurocapsales cyanobacterium LEGE 06147]|nr:helix-turn-helix transcriptional regulator [Pleurocapsales cyanobacterium LEGE 06147]